MSEEGGREGEAWASIAEINTLKYKQPGENHNARVYLLGVGAGVQAWHQVEDVAERHWVQVFDERREKVVDVTATVFQLKRQTESRVNHFIIWAPHFTGTEMFLYLNMVCITEYNLKSSFIF